MRSIAYSGRRSRNSKDGGAVLAVLFIGLALFVIGYVGVFFGRLIQAAVSRQREFLADASAVQFTRNPDGIGNALRRIGGAAGGTRLQSAHAVEHSHMFFGAAVSQLFGGVFATHPPLTKRIARVQADWDGTFLGPRPSPPPEPGHAKSESTADRYRRRVEGVLRGEGWPLATGLAAATGEGDADGGNAAADSGSIPLLQGIGELTPAQIAAAQRLIDALPEAVWSAAHSSIGSQAVVFALLLDRRRDVVRATQMKRLGQEADGPVFNELRQIEGVVRDLPRRLRLPLLDLAVPALLALPRADIDRLQTTVDRLIEADDQLDLFEWALRQILWRRLSAESIDRRPTTRTLQRVRLPAAVLIDTLVRVGQRDASGRDAAFAAAAAELPDLQMPRLEGKALAMSHLTSAVDDLALLRPLQKRQLVKACVAAVEADGRISPAEGELLRTVIETLGVPMPPLQIASEAAEASA
jgi:hypothetical protein